MLNKRSRIVISGANGAVGEILHNFFSQEKYQVEKLNFEDTSTKDAFIHLAAKSINSQDILISNIDYLKECIKYCKKVNIKYFVFFSTVSVYGNINALNVNEDTSFSNSPNIYGLSKLIGEELLKEENIKVLNLRLPAILTKNTTNTFISKLNTKLRNNEDITITNANKNFNNIIDVDTIYNFIINYNFKEKNNTYLLASSKEKTLKDIVLFLKKLNSSSSNIIEKNDISNFYNIDTSKASKEQRFKAKDIFEVLEQWQLLLKGY